MEQSIHHDYAFKVVFVQFAYCRNHLAIERILTFFLPFLESVWFFMGLLRSFSTVLVVTKFCFTLTFYFGVFSGIFEALSNNFYFL